MAGKQDARNGRGELNTAPNGATDSQRLSPAEGALAAVQDEANFIDLERSVIFLAKEHIIVDG